MPATAIPIERELKTEQSMMVVIIKKILNMQKKGGYMPDKNKKRSHENTKQVNGVIMLNRLDEK